MVQTTIQGLFQSDMLLKTAIEEGIKELRQAPYLLDYAFAYLPKDTITANRYGQKEIDRAKEWFLKTEIPVFFTLWTAEVRFPCVALFLGSSSESENTLGDVHYDPYEDNTDFWPDLTSPFTPISYNPFTGIMVLPSTMNAVVFSTDQSIVTRNGKVFPILEVPDNHSIVVAPNLNEDFNNIVIRGQKASMATPLEGAAFLETYAVVCCVNDIPTHVMYLHTIILFILLRRRQDLLEGRGFERSSVRSQDLSRDDKFVPEGVFARSITVNGYVRHFWPKFITNKINTIASQVIVENDGHMIADKDEVILSAEFIGNLDRSINSILPQSPFIKPIII